MSDQEQAQDVEENVVEPSADDVLAGDLVEQFGLSHDPMQKWGLGLVAEANQNIDVLMYLRDEKGFQILLDITAIDYLSFPGHRDARYAVVYLLKNIHTQQRVTIKVMLEEDQAQIRSVCGLWKIADWQEREVYDQYGIDFQGHPNQKRILNHHKFVGHPLRKDYPVQKRQKLDVNDPMLDQLHDDLERNGYRIVEAATEAESVQLGEQA